MLRAAAGTRGGTPQRDIDAAVEARATWKEDQERKRRSAMAWEWEEGQKRKETVIGAIESKRVYTKRQKERSSRLHYAGPFNMADFGTGNYILMCVHLVHTSVHNTHIVARRLPTRSRITLSSCTLLTHPHIHPQSRRIRNFIHSLYTFWYLYPPFNTRPHSRSHTFYENRGIYACIARHTASPMA